MIAPEFPGAGSLVTAVRRVWLMLRRTVLVQLLLPLHPGARRRMMLSKVLLLLKLWL